MKTKLLTTLVVALALTTPASAQSGEGLIDPFANPGPNYVRLALSHEPDMAFQFVKDKKAMVCPTGDERDKVEGILKLDGTTYAWGAIKFREDIGDQLKAKFTEPVMWVLVEEGLDLAVYFGGTSPGIYFDKKAEGAPADQFVKEMADLGWTQLEDWSITLTDDIRCESESEDCAGQRFVERLRLLRSVEAAGRCDHGVLASAPGKQK